MDLESHIRHLHGPKKVAYDLDELVVVCLVRDGRPYVKTFVEHYFSLGVKHIVFLDNGSSDATVSAAQSYANVTILQTELPFKEYKNSMRRYLITRFGRGRWILFVDIDELFDYPYSDVVSLSSLLRYLTEERYTAVVGQMLNMFPEKSVLNTAAREDEPLKELHRFYDISNITTTDYNVFNTLHELNNTLASDEIEVYRGGINKTLFGYNDLWTKHPLMFVDDEIRPLEGSEHWVGRARVADVTCVLLHYVFIRGLYEKAVRAAREESYAQNSRKYKMLLETLERDPEMHPKLETAQELGDVGDLVGNQFLVVSGKYMARVDAEERKRGTVAALHTDQPTRLVEAFTRVNAKARAEAKRVRSLERRVEQLEGIVDKKQETVDRKQRTIDKKQEIIDKKQRTVDKKQEIIDKKRRRIDTLSGRINQLESQTEFLRSKNRNLERQLEHIQNTRSWKLLTGLGRLRSGMGGLLSKR